MSVWSEFESTFSIENLLEIYEKHVQLSPATGIDNMTHDRFKEAQSENLSIINRKVINGNYNFTKYKLKLISKGRGKIPREISTPTIRDKIVLRALCDFLQKRFSSELDFSLPQEVIKKIKISLDKGEYTGFIKLDIANFYPSIPHAKLIKTIKRRVRDKRILALIESAIKTPTVSKPSSLDEKGKKGVPQGLSISNILASIFLSNIDGRFKKRDDLIYFRYVDDILILCQSENCNDIIKDIVGRFKKLGLTVYDPNKAPDKSTIGSIGVKDFSYLGYVFKNGLISARDGSVERLRESLISIFSGYKYSKIKSKKFLEWRLRLRVTGCIFQNKFKGWIFFFSEITEERLLHELDSFLLSLCKRYGIQDINPKSFVRTFYQANHHRYNSNYIPNFDKYTESEMVEVLEVYFNKKTEGLTSRQIEVAFLKRISRQVKDLETDVKDAGY